MNDFGYEIVYFKAESGDAYLNGYVLIDEIDDESPLNFTDNVGFDIGKNMRIYTELPFDATEDERLKVEKDVINLQEGFTQDVQLLQLLYDFKDETIILERDGYDLTINE